MGSYYYLGAQLPYLIYGHDAPMSSETFKNLALNHMSSSEAALLQFCTLDPDPIVDEDAGGEAAESTGVGDSYAEKAKRTSSSLINRWKEWERVLRLNLAKGRAQKLNREQNRDAAIPESPPEAVLAAKNALLIESPLEAEYFLDKARWDAIDSFQGMNIFNENAMYAYLLKLLLMERRAAFDTELGFNEYKGLYAAILESKNEGFNHNGESK